MYIEKYTALSVVELLLHMYFCASTLIKTICYVSCDHCDVWNKYM